MFRKHFNEKLNNSKDLSKVEFMGFDNKTAKRFGSGNMLIAAPVEYDEVMKRIPKGKLITSNGIREFLAKNITLTSLVSLQREFLSTLMQMHHRNGRIWEIAI